jgi:hypothetical protein
MVLLLLAMAAVLLSESLPLVMNPGPVEVTCPTQPRKLTCELGATLVRSLPTSTQRTVLGISGLAATAGVLWLAWLFTRTRTA